MNMNYYNMMKRPPKTALKQIQGGRLKGMTDIKPQWRTEVMTEVFGPCGIGWSYEIEKLWSEPAPDNQVFSFAKVTVKIKVDGEWSQPIPGIGGSMLIEKEKSGLHASDEAYKMAVTDALSVAMKALGVAADIYMGEWDGSKYRTQQQQLPAINHGHAEWDNVIDWLKAGAGTIELLKQTFSITPEVENMLKEAIK